MSTKVTLNIDPGLYQQLKNRFKDDEQGLRQFIIDATQKHLSELTPLPDDKDDLESYLQKGSSGSRTYGIKGQGW